MEQAEAIKTKELKYNLQSWISPIDMGKYNKIKNHLQNEVYKEKLSDGFIVRWILKNMETVGGFNLEEES